MNTTPYHIKIAPAAQRQIRALPQKERKIAIRLIQALAVNPRPPGAKKIEGMTGLYHDSINHVQLVYKVEEQEVLLLLVK